MTHTHEAKQYHVTASTGASLWDSHEGPFDTIEDARQAAMELARDYYGEDTYVHNLPDVDAIMVSPSREAFERYGGGYLICVDIADPDCGGCFDEEEEHHVEDMGMKEAWQDERFPTEEEYTGLDVLDESSDYPDDMDMSWIYGITGGESIISAERLG